MAVRYSDGRSARIDDARVLAVALDHGWPEGPVRILVPRANDRRTRLSIGEQLDGCAARVAFGRLLS